MQGVKEKIAAVYERFTYLTGGNNNKYYSSQKYDLSIILYRFVTLKVKCVFFRVKILFSLQLACAERGK